MEISFSKIINVAGIDDLFELVQSKNDNIFLKSLRSQKTSVFSINRNKIMNLENIQIYTIEDMMPLRDVLDALKTTNEIFPEDACDKETLYTFFLKLVPTLNREKVYFNNLKQILKWHKILLPYQLK